MLFKPVFVVGGDLFDHRQVARIAAVGYRSVDDCLPDGTLGFVNVCAVRITALFAFGKYLYEIVRNFVFVHIHCSEAFDARRVDDIRIVAEAIDFRKCRRVHSFVVIGGYFSCFCPGVS